MPVKDDCWLLTTFPDQNYSGYLFYSGFNEMKELMASKSYSGVVHSCAMRRQLCNHITNHVGFALFDYANDYRVLLALKILTFLINFPSRNPNPNNGIFEKGK